MYRKTEISNRNAIPNIMGLLNSSIILFVISLTSLSFEITITRYFSLIFSNYYIFLSISIALLGYGLGGFITSKFDLGEKHILLICILYGLAFFIPLFGPLLLPILLTHAVIMACIFLPQFLLAGIIISIYYRLFFNYVGVVYFSDLFGAGIGVLISIFLLNIFNPINVILIYQLIVLVTIILALRKPNYTIGFVVLFILLLINIKTQFIDIPFDKIPSNQGRKVMVQLLQKNKNARIEKTYWSYVFRTDIIIYRNNLETKAIFVDGGAPSIMFNARAGFENLKWLKNTINYLPFEFTLKENFLSIGPGGGLDIILGEIAGMNRIDAVEINPSIRKILEEYKDFNGNILNNPRLKFTDGEGRNFLRRNKQKYDLIFLSLSLTNTTTKTGIPYAESYLHTVEAYKDYYNHLKPNGVVALFCETYPFLLRSITTMTFALQESGINMSDTYKHLAIIQNFLTDSPYRYLVLFFKGEIDAIKAEAIKNEALKRNLIVKFLPFVYEKMDIKFASLDELEYFIIRMQDNEGINIKPVIDEKPFFFDFSRSPHWSFISLCIVTAILAVLMLLFLKRKGNYLLISNFYLLGAGFMLMEVSIIQKFIYFLGKPLLSFGVVLFSFLVACSLGGLFSIHYRKRIILILMPVIGLLLFFFIDFLMLNLGSINEVLQIIFVGIIIIIIGFPMGMFFPMIVAVLAKQHNADIGVAYGINGIMSVFGSVFAMIVAKYFGYKYNFLIAACLYVIVFLNYYSIKDQ